MFFSKCIEFDKLSLLVTSDDCGLTWFCCCCCCCCCCCGLNGPWLVKLFVNVCLADWLIDDSWKLKKFSLEGTPGERLELAEEFGLEFSKEEKNYNWGNDFPVGSKNIINPKM